MITQRRARSAFWGIGLLLAVSLVLMAILQPQYTSRSVLLATESPNIGVAGMLATAALQAGLNIGSATAMLELPRDLATDEVVLSRVSHLPLQSSNEAGVTTLVAHFDVQGPSQEEQALRAARKLRDHLSVDVNPGSGTLEFRLTMSDSLLSYSALAAVVNVVDSVHVASTVAHMSAVREFLEDQVSRAELDLRTKEDSLQAFLVANRTVAAPALQAELQRRTRDAEVQSQLFLGLLTQLAQARLDEANKIPTLSFIIPPTPPAFRDARPVQSAVLAGGFILLAQLLIWWNGPGLASGLPAGWSQMRRLLDLIGRQRAA